MSKYGNQTKAASGAIYKSLGGISDGSPTEERVTIKDYLVTWKNVAPDAEGLYRIKTAFRCDVKLLSAFMLTLPKDEHDFVCVTDMQVQLKKESEIKYLRERLESLENPKPKIESDGSEDDCDTPMMEDGADVEDYPTNYPSGRYDCYESVTYYTKDGKDAFRTFYDKEEIRRFSNRTLMLTDIIDDCKTQVSVNDNGKTEIRENGILIGAQG